jgi:hypothetical protein
LNAGPAILPSTGGHAGAMSAFLPAICRQVLLTLQTG